MLPVRHSVHRAPTARDRRFDKTWSSQLTYRPPYDWAGVLAFLAARELKGVEWVTDEFYARTIQLGNVRGWIRVTHRPGRNALLLEFTHSLRPVLAALLPRVRALFDLNARPDLIAAHLGNDRLLAPLVRQVPGIRVPGAFSGFELALRAVIGQQITVRSATTVGGRFAQSFGERIRTVMPRLNRLTPTAARVARASVGEVARLGIISVRARSLIALAQAQLSDGLAFDGGWHHPPDQAIRRLIELPGIGPWTAHYIAMRALSWTDAFPKEDIVVRNRLGGISPREAEARSQDWRPWRSYAVMHLWRSSAQTAATQSTSTSKWPGHAGTQTNIRAGGSRGK